LDAIGDDFDAVYILSPAPAYNKSQWTFFYEGLMEKKIPSMSLMDYPLLDYGAYSAFSSNENLQKIPRKIALNVSRIAEGKDPKDFSVRLENYTRQLIINMEAVNKTGIYPKWYVLDNAALINIKYIDDGRTLNLKTAIAESLENNLELQMAQKDPLIYEQEQNLAVSNYLPQIEVTSTGLVLDKNTVESSFGTKGEFNWSAALSFSQLVLSEPALANITIQELLKESKEKYEEQSELDVVLDVVTAYFTYRQVLSLVELQNENIKVKQENLKIAIDKEKVGYSGESDVYRWETELALAKTDLNTAMTQLKSARFQLNQILNRPIDEEFTTQDETSGYLSHIFERQFISLIDNPGTVQILADFLVAEAFKKLPEIQQIELTLQAQERMLKSLSRAYYIPTIAVAANYDYPLSTVNPGEPLAIPGVEPTTIEPTWNVAVVASFPVFTGLSKKYQKQKSEVELYQLQDQYEDLKNKLEQLIRTNLENVQTSYRNLQLSEDAAESAEKNVVIIQDLYNEGQISVTSLIDAQNAYLTAEINASNAMYQLLLDLFALERSAGEYMSIATEEQRSDFMKRFSEFKNQQ
jgi:outer membrane protein